MKRFKVSDKFAGMNGPCPNCKTIISIPKASIKIHGDDEIETGKNTAEKNNTGKSGTGRPVLKPISRLDLGFDVKEAKRYFLITLGVFLFAFLIGFIVPRGLILNIIGVIGLCAIAFPISLFGYQLLRDKEELFMLTGSDLYKTTGTCAVIYAAIWISFEIFVWYMRADYIFVWVYFFAFGVFAALLAHAVLDITFGNSALHFLIFSFIVLLLRGITNIGWLWNVSAIVRDTSPILPGM
ncbi:MAG: hypothetical protein LBP59_05615 [Planctomycetaceae bacterium]|jgi:hypothetical protein|nr:hypothetical protein [Planctomycetaceae bacterium]